VKANKPWNKFLSVNTLSSVIIQLFSWIFAVEKYRNGIKITISVWRVLGQSSLEGWWRHKVGSREDASGLARGGF
jgi:hypothetical protein